MRISMIGTGYVGLVSGACFSQFGIDVTCVDTDEAKIERLKRGEIPIYEPGLEELVRSNVADNRLDFSTDLEASVADRDAVFIAVGTPSRRGDGHADLSYVYAAAEQIAGAVTGYTVVANKSTVPLGTAREVERIIRQKRPSADVDVVSNPEFLREGSAIEDFTRPDRVVIGVESARAREVMQAVYRPLFLNETPIVWTGRESAELIKYATNAFLATKVTFINELADLCDKVGADVHEIARGIGLDGRIGPKFLHPGPGYGGSCFPKDTLALVRTAQDAGAPVRVVESVIDVNQRRKKGMVARIVHALGVVGANRRPVRHQCGQDIQSRAFAHIIGVGLEGHAQDGDGLAGDRPAARTDDARGLIPGVEWCSGPYEAMAGADALVILTEWNEFRLLDLPRTRKLLNSPVMVDLRNIYDPEEMAAAGFFYTSLGRPGSVAFEEASLEA